LEWVVGRYWPQILHLEERQRTPNPAP
jgi:hypothetical protein